MGPVSYVEFDSRADDKKQDDDWADNINPYVISYNQSEVWRSLNGLLNNNIDEEASDPERYTIRDLTN